MSLTLVHLITYTSNSLMEPTPISEANKEWTSLETCELNGTLGYITR
jgi:hypothetical protein